jgi:bifunctional non-homologous end joining protein LigD
VTLLSRRGKDWTKQFPELVAAARKLKVQQALLDGEAAVLLDDGRTSFQALQNYFGGQRRGLVYFAFDLLHLDGEDLAPLPLDRRKDRLAQLLREGAPGLIRLSEHVVGHGRDFFAHASRLGLEGIVSKRRACPYRGGRTTDWLKIKCIKRQELVIGGFTDPEGARHGIGALLVGVHDAKGRLTFAGKVGTGFSQKAARELREKLDALAQKACPFDPPPTGPDRHAHWVAPQLVAEVAFAEWTGDGKVRHASFQGLRTDKPAKDVVAELPQETAMIETSKTPRKTAKPAPAPKAAATTPKKHARIEVAGIGISNPDRVLYPDAGVTKLDLARYYAAIEGWILPHVVGRPLSLVRCPKGLTGAEDACFYMKHSSVWAPPALRRVHIKEKTKRGQYLVIEDLAGVVSLAQMDVLEIHTWNSPADDVERPNRVVFDLDPGPEVPWPQVIEAARMVRASLASLELECWVKNTGGNGLHVVVPIAPGPSWDDCLEFTRGLSAAIARSHPDRYTIAIPKAGREKKILIDFLRNNRGSTSVAAFSSRARDGAPVSVPLGWDELSPQIPANHYTVASVPERLVRLRHDPWAGYWKSKQTLDPATLKAVAGLR